ncbi:hypothetical protein B0H10DRAFT_2285042 [Mycena sp. CBHHK59/15]|nr:hypothetical protein B0H10DRAFT_2285042 [Mycena sp. CBHHK59/15]
MAHFTDLLSTNYSHFPDFDQYSFNSTGGLEIPVFHSADLHDQYRDDLPVLPMPQSSPITTTVQEEPNQHQAAAKKRGREEVDEANIVQGRQQKTQSRKAIPDTPGNNQGILCVKTAQFDKSGFAPSYHEEYGRLPSGFAEVGDLFQTCVKQSTAYPQNDADSLASGFHPSGFATGRRAVTTGRDPSVQYFSVRFRRPGTGRVDPSTGHPLPVRRRVDGSTKDRVNQRRDDGVLWRIGKAAITAGFPSIRQDEFQLWDRVPLSPRAAQSTVVSTLELSTTTGVNATETVTAGGDSEVAPSAVIMASSPGELRLIPGAKNDTSATSTSPRARLVFIIIGIGIIVAEVGLIIRAVGIVDGLVQVMKLDPRTFAFLFLLMLDTIFALKKGVSLYRRLRHFLLCLMKPELERAFKKRAAKGAAFTLDVFPWDLDGAASVSAFEQQFDAFWRREWPFDSASTSRSTPPLEYWHQLKSHKFSCVLGVRQHYLNCLLGLI